MTNQNSVNALGIRNALGKLMYKPVLDRSYNPVDGSYSTFRETKTNGYVSVRLNFVLGDGSYLVSRTTGNRVSVILSFRRTMLKENLVFGENPFINENLLFFYNDTYTEPRYATHKPNSNGKYGVWEYQDLAEYKS